MRTVLTDEKIILLQKRQGYGIIEYGIIYIIDRSMIEMTTEIRVNDGILTAKPIGRLDSATSGEFETQLLPHITGDLQGVIIDMSCVDYISSKGLRVLVSAYRAHGGKKIDLVGVNRSVLEVLRLSGMLKVFAVKEG